MENMVRLIKAATALVKAMDEIQDSPEYRRVWATASHCDGQYRGRQWKRELEALRKYLNMHNTGRTRAL
jgi:hypothetical protein